MTPRVSSLIMPPCHPGRPSIRHSPPRHAAARDDPPAGRSPRSAIPDSTTSRRLAVSGRRPAPGRLIRPIEFDNCMAYRRHESACARRCGRSPPTCRFAPRPATASPSFHSTVLGLRAGPAGRGGPGPGGRRCARGGRQGEAGRGTLLIPDAICAGWGILVRPDGRRPASRSSAPAGRPVSPRARTGRPGSGAYRYAAGAALRAINSGPDEHRERPWTTVLPNPQAAFFRPGGRTARLGFGTLRPADVLAGDPSWDGMIAETQRTRQETHQGSRDPRRLRL
jgi:hypothetical protein